MFTYHYILETKTHSLFSFQELEGFYLQVHLHDEDSNSTCFVSTNCSSSDECRLLLLWFQLNCEIYALPIELQQLMIETIHSELRHLK